MFDNTTKYKIENDKKRKRIRIQLFGQNSKKNRRRKVMQSCLRDEKGYIKITVVVQMKNLLLV
jgi:hypothetical protein